MSGTMPWSYFDEMYSASGDPWKLSTRWYERRKYACSVAALPKPYYHSGYEPGCSIGVLSTLLADRCHRLLCTDHMPIAVQAARHRLAERGHVRVEQQTVPGEWPIERFDLVVASELGYYFDERDRGLLWERVAESLEPGGTLLAVHWRPSVPDYPADGDTVHAELARNSAFHRLVQHLESDFILEIYQREPSPVHSVAEHEGLR